MAAEDTRIQKKNVAKFLGYDVRDLDEKTNHMHDPRWVTGFCYRPDIWRPLSADEWTWPYPKWLRARDFFAPMMLCQDIDDLRDDIRDSPPPINAAYAIIALSYYPSGDTPDPEWKDWNQPEFELRGARLLGYDVCDWMTSAISNCGLSEDGTPDERWPKRINQFHLLDTLEDAHDFVKYADSEIPEHAPFTPIGAWLVESVNIKIP